TQYRSAIFYHGPEQQQVAQEMIASVLQQKFVTHKTTGNLNNHLGVPLTLSELTYGPEVAVVEMGTNHFGEIAALCEIAAPNYGVITNVGRAHTEFLGDLSGVAKAKGELFEYLHRNDGVAFLNADDAYLRAALPSGAKAITFGIDKPAQYQGKVLGLEENGCVQLEVQKTQIRLNVPGLHHAHNALAAVAIGSFLGVPMSGIKKGLESFETPAKRMQVQRMHGVTIINDAYNANPESMRAALQFLAAMSPAEHGRRIAILGDMLELGPHADAYHREIGEFITTLPIQAVFAFGPHMKHAVQAIGQYCWAEHFEAKPQLIAEVNRSLRAGDVVLLKGSRSMAMEEVVVNLKMDA
ncbi:UDP-N-acetylmuramoyl-tripeptide--D-alanyl-D-alanine ligase, partial [candidate division KSB1 bacterium]|nr:UDP-N-acetylmuramoyl-tripeptide--D-alanyl-D-alanine ligase [candidate division KSB1 bacterium]